MHGHVTWPFNHHLDIMVPGYFGQFSQGLQFGKLCFIISVGYRAGTQSIAQREGHIIGFHNFANILKMGIEKIFLVMSQTPLGHN